MNMATLKRLPCVDCGAVSGNQVADHIDPLVVQYYRDGAVDVAAQGGQLSAFSRAMKKCLGLQ